MNYKEAQTLAELVVAAAPWAESVYTLPLKPDEQTLPTGPYMVSLSSEFSRAEFYSPQDWLETVRQLEPTPGPGGLPLIDKTRFVAWVRQQLARTDLSEHEQRCTTKDPSLFTHRPWLNPLCVEVAFTATVAPVVESCDRSAYDARTPTVSENMLTVRWNCPACGHQAVPTLDGSAHLTTRPNSLCFRHRGCLLCRHMGDP